MAGLRETPRSRLFCQVPSNVHKALHINAVPRDHPESFQPQANDLGSLAKFLIGEPRWLWGIVQIHPNCMREDLRDQRLHEHRSPVRGEELKISSHSPLQTANLSKDGYVPLKECLLTLKSIEDIEKPATELLLGLVHP